MFGKGYRLYKREKLCSVTAIERLFKCKVRSAGHKARLTSELGSELVYPVRMVYALNERRNGPLKFLISVPKKRIRHAVDRVTMRRRIRESYRMARGPVENLNDVFLKPVDVAFIYVADEMCNYRRVEKAMFRLVAKLSEIYSNTQNTPGT